ncbi:Isoamyl acetate-hydrolyzing esterase 1 like, partial [Pseudolycoriella hygida]
MADIITRGFSGYNTRWYKMMLPKILDSINTKDISCVTIFLGANDCSLPKSDQHVPVVEYQENLEAMVELRDGEPEPLRSEEQQKIYAKAMMELGQRLCLSVVDTYSAFEADGRGHTLFVDGLHFSGRGSDLLYQLVVKEIEKRVLAFRGEDEKSQTVNYARWRDVDPQDLERTIFQAGRHVG